VSKSLFDPFSSDFTRKDSSLSKDLQNSISNDYFKGSDYFKGIIQRITYQNAENGFSVIRAELAEGKDSGTSHTVIGSLPTSLIEGGVFVARGVWQTHAKFGKQFKAYSITESLPTTTEAITRYLSSGLVKGIGEKLAERIVNHFGEATLQVIEETPDRLSEVNGIGQSKIDELKEIWNERKDERETLLFFQSYGISTTMARRIYKSYGSKSIETVKSNPYILCEEIWGIGFLTADRIAYALGIDTYDIERLMAGISYTLDDSQSNGHTYLPYEELLQKTKSLLKIDDETTIAKALNHACLSGKIYDYNQKYYRPTLFNLERKAAECIAKRAYGKKTIHKDIPVHLVEETISTRNIGTAFNDSITLSEEQKEAVHLAATSPLLLITGGPGCGKTTIVKSIGMLFKKAGLSIRLAAPTGRAAQRLQEVCGIEASTIHRLLKYDPMKRCFIHDESDPLPFDVLIVDESSMIDIPLAASLLKAVSDKTRLIFVGDADQLPSVGPGLFFPDLLTTEEVPKVKLTRLFRRAEESSINDIAHLINQGVSPAIPEPDGSGIRDAYLLKVKDQEEAGALIERLVCEQVPKKFDVRSEHITVLSPMNQGALGIIALNKRLQSRLIQKGAGTPSVKIGSTEFHVGDRVCQRVNNYTIHTAGVFNGEQGVIFGIDTEAKSLYVKMWDGREVTYTGDTIHQLDLAYALTIHRSQGSEVPVVILVLHDSHHIMLERQLIYTAVTRAKKLLLVVGTKSALNKATKQIRSSKRFTALKELIEEARKQIHD
jgi:exodeoxyribonuclease V alpha subunit